MGKILATQKKTHWRRLVDKGYTVGTNMRGQQIHYSEKGAKTAAKRLREDREWKETHGGYLAQAVYVNSAGMEPYWIVMYRRRKP